jgi:hypothetical protein
LRCSFRAGVVNGASAPIPFEELTVVTRIRIEIAEAAR